MFPLQFIPQIRGAGLSGGGVNPVDIVIVDQDGDPVQFVKVSIYSGSDLRANEITNADGEISTALDDGTYVIVATLGGYNPLNDTLVISGVPTESFEYELERISITPSTGDAVTGYATVYDDDNQPAADVIVQANFIKLEGSGRIDIGGYKEATSNSEGLVEFVDYFIPGGQYQIRVKVGGQWQPIVADDADFALPNLRK